MLVVRGRIASDADRALRIFRIPDPAAFARTAFVQALRRAGIEVDARVNGRNPRRLLPARGSYEEAALLAERVSPPLAQYVKVVLKVSYNRGADLFACLLAVSAGSRSCLDGLAPVMETIGGLGVSADSTFLFDGAGGDEADRTTPRDMTAFLRSVPVAPYGESFADGLPILGRDGSLARTLVGSPAAGHVFAKTGTRAGTSPTGATLMTGQTFVGYIDAVSGRRLAFSLMVNNVPLRTFDDIFRVFSDQGEMAEALQQGL